jgi:hypothetical protein
MGDTTLRRAKLIEIQWQVESEKVHREHLQTVADIKRLLELHHVPADSREVIHEFVSGLIEDHFSVRNQLKKQMAANLARASIIHDLRCQL